MGSSEFSNLSVEPSVLRGLAPAQKERLTDILNEYLSALDNGVPPQPEDLLRAHPDLAGPLQVYLNSLAELHDAAAVFGHPTYASPAVDALPDGAEKRLGDFVLIREIGRGGMGVVYESRQISLGRRVALKVLPFAAVLDSQQIARFHNEAQAAAQLHHPNIVPVFAVGVERGVHFYAMQFIDGQPLDRAIAELRRRSRGASGAAPAGESEAPTGAEDDEAEAVRESTIGSFLTDQSTSRQQYIRTVVRLAIQAAEAIHAAHEYGIVHRDIKPSNLLLSGDGKLWVTDFGLARCQSDARLTKTGDVVGTMRYMSPEQALGRSALVDHRTDVYSLGATLYELLALRPAFPDGDGAALARRIEQHEPPRIRQFRPETPSDLETVVFKAMAKRREHRYTTAQEFADDLRCVLDGKPTLARPPSFPDRLGKWARRHRRIAGAVAAACLLAVLGLTASTLLISREKSKAQQNYERAEANFRQARGVVDDFGAQLAEQLAGIPGAEQIRRRWLGKTLQYYRNFAEQAGHDLALRADLALTYSKIGTLTGQIGDLDDAIAAHEKARRILAQLAADEPGLREHRRRLALCENNLGLALTRAGRVNEAGRAYRGAIRLQQELVSASPEVASWACELALSHNNLGLLQSQTSAAGQAESSFREAIRLQQRLVNASPEDPEHLRNLAASYNNLSSLYAVEQPTRAAELCETALKHQQKAIHAHPDELKQNGELALMHNNLGSAQAGARRYSDAAESYRRAIGIQRALTLAAPADKSYRRDLAVSFNNLGLAQSKLGRCEDAEASFRQALALQEPLVGEHEQDLSAHSSLGGVYNNLGIVLEELRRTSEAAESYRKAVEHQRLAYLGAPTVSRYRVFLSKHYYNYGRALRELGRPEQAALAALARKDLWPSDPQRLLAVAEELALASRLLESASGAAMTAQQCAAEAIETLRQAIAVGLEPPADLDRREAFAALKDQTGFAELVKK